MDATKRQEIIDRYYTERGPCCAGCDWWHHVNSVAGECRRSAPVAGAQRYALMGMRFIAARTEAGHVMTPRHHVCGEFRDDFDWSTLPAHYLRAIGRNRDPKGVE